MLISVARTAQRSAVVAEASCLSSGSLRPGICVPAFRLFWVFRSIDPNHEARRLVHVGERSQPLMFGCVQVQAVSWVAIFEQKTGKAGGIEIRIIRVRSCASVVPIRGAISRRVTTLGPSA
mgnify:CR=1 FL=1